MAHFIHDSCCTVLSDVRAREYSSSNAITGAVRETQLLSSKTGSLYLIGAFTVVCLMSYAIDDQSN